MLRSFKAFRNSKQEQPPLGANRIRKLPERSRIITLPVTAKTRLKRVYELISGKNVVVSTEHNIVTFNFQDEKDLFPVVQRAILDFN